MGDAIVKSFLYAFRQLRTLKIRLHPLFFLLMLVAVVVGLWLEALLLFTFVILHELGHVIAAKYVGYDIESVTLYPFGGAARLAYGNIGFQPTQEAFIAVAGPLVNLILACMALGLHWAGGLSDFWFGRVVELNSWIVLFNMLPGLPLDGGRILRAAQTRKTGYETATREAYRVSLWIATGLLITGAVSLWAGYPHLGTLILGVFLFLSAWVGRREVAADTVRFLDAKRRTKGHPEPVRSIAAPVNSTVRDVVRQFAPDRYHLVYVRNQDGGIIAVIEENELLEAVFHGNWLDSLEHWTKRE
ncbi:peptidase M50 [Alicyclobacillaceae bacterium I2511]|nr:peptidase M50 [Alicyclobacillaceae bacterium I2511]